MYLTAERVFAAQAKFLVCGRYIRLRQSMHIRLDGRAMRVSLVLAVTRSLALVQPYKTRMN